MAKALLQRKGHSQRAAWQVVSFQHVGIGHTPAREGLVPPNEQGEFTLRLNCIRLIFALALSGIVLSGTSANADDFSFTITNTDGNVSGTVTGEILGLTDNSTGPATQVLIESYPAAFASIVGPGPIDATQFFTQLENSFTEVNGVVTAGTFGAYNPAWGSTFDELVINYGGQSTMQACSYPCYLYEYVSTEGGFPSANIQPLTSSVSQVPEPSTLLLTLTGVVGLVGRFRKKSLLRKG
jgi:hypothetical protein